MPPTILELAKQVEGVPTPAGALEQFCIPPRIAMARREAEDMAGAEPFQFENRGDKISAWSLGEGPVTVLSHGWGGRASQLIGFAHAVVERGHRAILFDAPAHGDSEGRLSTALRVSECILTLSEQLGPIHSLVGHSFGVIGANIALWRGLQVERVAYVAGLVHVPQRFIEWGYAVGLDDDGVQAYMDLAEKEFGHGMLESISGDRIAPKQTAEALIIHDEEDNEILIYQAEALAAAWPKNQFVRTTGLGHRRIIRSGEIIRQVAEFVTSKARVATEVR